MKSCFKLRSFGSKTLNSLGICLFILSITLHKGLLANNSTEKFISADGKVRLNSLISYAAGRVEVLYYGQWSTICNNSWNVKASMIVCKQLGFKGGYTLKTLNPGKGKIAMKYVDCDEDDTSIFDCKYQDYLIDCDHDEDVNVKCFYEYDAFCDFKTYNCRVSINSSSNNGESISTYIWKYSKPYEYFPIKYIDKHFNEGDIIYLDSKEGKPGDKADFSNKTLFDQKTGSIVFSYYLQGDQILNAFIGSGVKGHLVWSNSKPDESDWHLACLNISKPIKDLVITLEGIRGSNASSVAAIRNIRISTKYCEPESVNCSFNHLPCGYKIIGSKSTFLKWILTRPFTRGPLFDHTANSLKGGFMSLYNGYFEGDRSSLQSPIFHTKKNNKIEFYYYLSGPNPGELLVKFVPVANQQNITGWRERVLWQDYGDHGTEWNYGCVNLPPNQSGSIVFTAVVGTTKDLNIAIDDISVSTGTCQREKNIQNSCSFTFPRLCNYTIDYVGKREYTWLRHKGTTPTLGTGPDRDFSDDGNGFYLYTESSYGQPGDTATVTFPLIPQQSEKFLRFGYHMFGKDVGNLHLLYHSYEMKLSTWTAVGSQGNKWRTFCSPIKQQNVHAFSFLAIRGRSYLGDIAIDNVQVSEKRCPHPLDCDFNIGICNYDFEINNDSYSWIRAANSTYKENGYFLEISTNPKCHESMVASLVSPEIKETNSNRSLRFLYQMNGEDVNKLEVFARISKNKEYSLWSNNDNTITDWIMGCINLPSEEKMRIVFKSINGFGPHGITRLDNLTYHHQKCPIGIFDRECKFDNPKLCNYQVRSKSRLYRWIRRKVSPTNDTGPYPKEDSPNTTGFFIYAESSQGSPGDKTELIFNPSSSPFHHYVQFYYNMNGEDIGELQVQVVSASQVQRWSNEGNLKNNWFVRCLNLTAGEKTTIIFTALRGNGPLGDIAVDNISIRPGFCPSESFTCDFNDDFLCGYRNISTGSSWIRVYKDSESYMKALYIYDKSIMRSPLVNLTNSCVRIHYQISSCEINVNNGRGKKLLILYSNGNRSDVGQFYIEKAEMFIQIEAFTREFCDPLISKVETLPGKCPSLDCPNDTIACNDQRYCILKSWVCDTHEDCLDGSDESICPVSIVCKFENAHMCGYKTEHWWLRNQGYIFLGDSRHNASLFSPEEKVEDVCVRFSYLGRNPFSLYVVVHHENEKINSSYIGWQLQFKNQELSRRIGQFFIPAGKISLEFQGFTDRNSFVEIGNITFIKGDCPTLNCPVDSFLCYSEEKCITKKDKCNRNYECEDKSDENNCDSSIDCDFEDNYVCGYQFENGWKRTTGRYNQVPLYDHSKGDSYGHYMSPDNSNQYDYIHLESPKKEFTQKICLTFYYFSLGYSKFQIYDDYILNLHIPSLNIGIWQKGQLQLDEGHHKLRFSVLSKNPDDKFALDSISTTQGSCPEFFCKENWKRCQPENICIPHHKFCDHVRDCPNGYDEYACESFQSVRLVGGTNFQQGYAEYFFKDKWQSLCESSDWPEKNSKVICNQLGYHGKTTTSLKYVQDQQLVTDIRRIRCQGKEDSMSSCNRKMCFNCLCKKKPYIDCSHTNCSSSQLPCPVIKSIGKPSQPQICLEKELFCNGEQDCPSGTDEQNCSLCYTSEQFQCLDKKCISKSKRCDGVSDCQDSSDEYNCFIQEGNLFLFLHEQNYQHVCQKNLNKRKIANKLCNAIGKGNAKTIHRSFYVGKGIEFSKDPSSKNKFFPGLTPRIVSYCKRLNVSCEEKECGKRENVTTTKIIKDGIMSYVGQWPWQVLIMKNDYEFCGGTLVHPKYVLTSTHCSREHNNTYFLKLGTTNKTDSGQRYEIKRKIFHSESANEEDLVLLELTEPVQISDSIRPACLPSKPWNQDMNCFSTGWGELTAHKYATDLKEVKAHILSRDDCISHFNSISQNHLCAVANSYNLECVVDFGGPLVCQNEHGLWELVGVTAKGQIYCLLDRINPVTYFDVYKSLKWIKQNIEN